MTPHQIKKLHKDLSESDVFFLVSVKEGEVHVKLTTNEEFEGCPFCEIVSAMLSVAAQEAEKDIPSGLNMFVDASLADDFDPQNN